MNQFSKFRKLERSIYTVIALALAVAGLLPAFIQNVAAISQVTSRSIQMSDSAASTAGASYKVTFTPATSVSAGGGIVVDICDNDPIVGDTSCTFPAGFDWGGATPSLTVNSGMGGAGWTAAGVQGGAGSGKSQVLELTSSTGTLTASTPAVFTISSVTNPSTANHSFYARIVTFDTAAHMTSNYTISTTTRAATFAGEQDYGGIALSTASTILVTAKVQEQLAFCVYTTGGCGTNAGVTLGNTQGVLSSSGPFVDKNTFYDIQTNASGGAIVNVKGNTLTSGSNTIAAIQPTALVSSTGTSQFGLCNYESSGTNLSYTTNPYNGNNGAAPGSLCSGTSQTAGTGSTGGDNSAKFLFSNNAQGTYGDTIANDAAGSTSTGNVVFIGNVSTSQTAGIYTTTLQFIATGTF